MRWRPRQKFNHSLDGAAASSHSASPAPKCPLAAAGLRVLPFLASRIRHNDDVRRLRNTPRRISANQFPWPALTLYYDAVKCLFENRIFMVLIVATAGVEMGQSP